MNITTITDLKELKAMVYDQLVIKQTAEQTLTMINQRISQLSDIAGSDDIEDVSADS